MTPILQWIETTGSRRRARLGIVVTGVAMLLLCGCAERRAHAVPWATAIRVRPVLPAQAEAPATESAPQFAMKAPPASAPLAPPSSSPPRPHAAMPAIEPVPAQKPATPTMAPALSLEEVASSRQQVDQSLAVAQETLSRIHGRSLNAAQADIASKIESFMGEAREAATAQDWTRARSLAKKAEVLAGELRSTL